MSTDASTVWGPLSPFERLQYARQVIRLEADALQQVAKRLDGSFCRAVDLLYGCRGSVITSGMGKAGLIAQKAAATLASTGTRSHFLHPGEAFHGDLGRVHQDDVLLMFSQSGQTEEVVRLLSSLEDFGVSIIAVNDRAGYLYPSAQKDRFDNDNRCTHVLTLMQEGKLEPKRLVTHRLHYSEMVEAYEMAYRREKNMLNVVFNWKD